MRGRRHGQRHDHRAALTTPQDPPGDDGRRFPTVPFDPAYDASYDPFARALRDFLDRVAEARPDPALLASLAASLDEWGQRLEAVAVPERERPYGRRMLLDGRGQATTPATRVGRRDDDRVSATVSFGSWFIGGNGAAHGGAIPLLFDEVMGLLARSGRSAARTAYLHTDYRSIVPIGPDLALEAWVDREEGRKRYLRATLTHHAPDGPVLCAEAEALFVALRPGQP